MIYALTIATVAFTGLEAACGPGGRGGVGRARPAAPRRAAASGDPARLRRHRARRASARCRSRAARRRFGTRYLEAPLLGGRERVRRRRGWRRAARTRSRAAATVTLLAAANSAMLGISRLAYSLATNRQIPSALGRLHPTRGTPFVRDRHRRALAAALIDPATTSTSSSASTRSARCSRSRSRTCRSSCCATASPTASGPTAMPLSVRVRRRLAAAAGGARARCCRAPAGSASSSLHEGARYVGLAWLLFGLALYVVYRRTEGKPLLKRVTIPERGAAQRARRGRVRLDPRADLRQRRSTTTSSRRPAGSPARSATTSTSEGATIEAIWVFEMPMSLPIDARLPERAGQARAGGAAAREGGGGGVRGRPGRDGDGARAPRRARRSSTRRGGAASRRSCSPPRSRRACAAARCSAGAAGRWTTTSARSRSTSLRKAACRVILTAPARPEARASRRRERRARTAASRRRSRPCSSSIVGAGRVGSAVAKRALGRGTRSRCSTRTRSRTSGSTRTCDTTWEDAGGRFTVGTALEIDALIEAGIEQADVFIASTNGDNTNLVDRPDRPEALRGRRSVVVRVLDPARAAWYAEQGLHTICPTQHAIEMVEQPRSTPRHEGTRLMYVIVAGAGKVGWNLARELLGKGHEVTLIESDRRRYLTSSRSSSTPSSTATRPSCGCSSAPASSAPTS